LQLAYSGECQKFITTFAVQKCLLDLWNNGYEKQLRFCRIEVDTNEMNFHKIDFKILASYLTIGLAAPILLYPNDNKIKNENERFSIISTNSNSNNEIEKTNKKQKEYSTYLFKYKNFMCSPKTNFVYETVFYVLFLLTFSYFLLCEFKYYDHSLKKNNNKINNTLIINISSIYINEKLASVSWIEYFLTYWIVSFLFRLIFEAIMKFKSKIWNRWNYLNLVGCILFFIAITLRYIAMNNKSLNTFKVARVVLCVDLLVWFARSLFFMKCFNNLGPKIVMIMKMVKIFIYL